MSIFQGLFARMMESERLVNLEKEMQSARIQGKNYCVKCGFCCMKRTCIPTPKELKKIAEFLKMTPKELINRYYAIDRMSFKGIYYVKPLGENIKDLAGKFIPSDRTFNEGKCVFLTFEGKIASCKIHKVRPKSSQQQYCWKEPSDEEIKKWRKARENAWEDNKLLTEFGIDGKELEEGL